MASIQDYRGGFDIKAPVHVRWDDDTELKKKDETSRHPYAPDLTDAPDKLSPAPKESPPDLAINITENSSGDIDDKIAPLFKNIVSWLNQQKLSRSYVAKKLLYWGSSVALTFVSSSFAIRKQEMTPSFLQEYSSWWTIGGAATSAILGLYLKHRGTMIEAQQDNEKEKLYNDLECLCRQAINKIFQEYIDDTLFENKYTQAEMILLGYTDEDKIKAQKEQQITKQSSWGNYMYNNRHREALLGKKTELICEALQRFIFTGEQVEKIRKLFKSAACLIQSNSNDPNNELQIQYEFLRNKSNDRIKARIREAEVMRGNYINFDGDPRHRRRIDRKIRDKKTQSSPAIV